MPPERLTPKAAQVLVPEGLEIQVVDLIDLMSAVVQNLPDEYMSPGDIRDAMIRRGEGTTIGRPWTPTRVRAMLEILASHPDEFREVERITVKDGFNRSVVRFRRRLHG